MKQKLLFLFAINILFPLFLLAQGTTTGLKVMELVYNRSEGENRQSDLTMTLTNSRGEKRIRKPHIPKHS